MLAVIILGICLFLTLLALVWLVVKKYKEDKASGINDLINKLTIKDNKIDSLKEEIERLKITLDISERQRKKLFYVQEGDNAILTLDLMQGSADGKQIRFRATIEVEITEISTNKAKVKAIKAITDNNGINKDPISIRSICDFVLDKWYDISDLDPILDESDERDEKIQQILN